MRDNTVDIFAAWFQVQGCAIEAETILVVDGRRFDLVSLANWLEIKEKQGLRFTNPLTTEK
jgi:hypothetical protein